jgi:hypothetical protein
MYSGSGINIVAVHRRTSSRLPQYLPLLHSYACGNFDLVRFFLHWNVSRAGIGMVVGTRFFFSFFFLHTVHAVLVLKYNGVVTGLGGIDRLKGKVRTKPAKPFLEVPTHLLLSFIPNPIFIIHL